MAEVWHNLMRMDRVHRLLCSVTVAALLVAGCAADTPEAAAPTSPVTSVRQVGPQAFAAEIASGDRFVVNVHTPDEGRIDGTDADIRFNQLEERTAELPQDRAAPVAVYCRTGTMSETAIDTLVGSWLPRTSGHGLT